MAIVFQGMEIIGEKRCNDLFLPWQDFVVLMQYQERLKADLLRPTK